jgi:hypothetical protein
MYLVQYYNSTFLAFIEVNVSITLSNGIVLTYYIFFIFREKYYIGSVKMYGILELRPWPMPSCHALNTTLIARAGTAGPWCSTGQPQPYRSTAAASVAFIELSAIICLAIHLANGFSSRRAIRFTTVRP